MERVRAESESVNEREREIVCVFDASSSMVLSSIVTFSIASLLPSVASCTLD